VSQTHHGALPVGTRIESYEIASVLGVGGFGITYKGYDHSLHCDVAIKEYLPSGLALRTADGATIIPKSDDDRKYYEYGLKRFLDEARILAKFKERSIVRVSRFLESNGTAYLIMDYEDGESLAEYLQKAGVLNEQEILAIILPVLEGLQAVHARDFLHRDIKPGNIYLRKHGPPVLLDFGAARQALGEQTRALTGMVTPGYAPFEQYNSRTRQGPWTDLYALGATIYHCITGRAPAESPDRIAALQEQEADPMTPATVAARGRYRPEFLATVDWMLAPSPKDRPQSVEQVLARLKGLGPGAADAAPDNGFPRTRTVPVTETQTHVVAPPVSQPVQSTRDELEAFKAMRRRAEGGEAEAQFRLGVMYAYGRGTARDEAEAARWLREAAGQDHATAQTRLGLMLARGAGVQKDEAEAADWLRRAAEHNDPVAQFNLGLMHAHGLGVSKDRNEALRWYRQAAAQGHHGARVNLGVLERGASRRSWWVWAGAALFALVILAMLVRR
jgi:serine/threonine protein kinase